MSILRVFMVALLLPFSSLVVANKPNIVVILADDIGVGDISFYTEHFMDKQPVFSTPSIDSLAKNGVWFSDAHSATALCSPTRYAVMTGKNNYRSSSPWGVWDMFSKNAIDWSDSTIARVVKDAGYNTGFVGKWHLGGDFHLKAEKAVFRGSSYQKLSQVDLSQMHGGGPSDMGFNYSFMLPDGIQGPVYLAYENESWYPLSKQSTIDYISKDNVYDPKMISGKGAGMGDTHWRTEKMGEILADKAVTFIKQQSSDMPFMLYYASPMAHLPHMPPKFFKGVEVAGTAGSAHMDMIKALDLQVGSIVEALKGSNRLKDTLIIFTSDNGGLTWRVPGTKESGHQVSGKFRGSKNVPHEGGHRVPFIAHWPDKISVSSISDELVVVQDILATIAAIAGNPQSKDAAPDSNNLLPLLLKSDSFQSREIAMLQGGSRHEVIYREGKWKLIMQSDHKLTKFEPIALFDLDENVEERESENKVNVSAYKKLIHDLNSRYLTLRRTGASTVW